LSLSLTLAGTALLLILIIGLLMTDVLRSLQALTKAASEFAGGNFDARVVRTGNDEVGILCRQFNTMAVELKQSYGRILQEKARFEASIDSLPLGFMMTGTSNQIVNMNYSMGKMLGLHEHGVTLDQVAEKIQNQLLSTLLEHTEQCLKE